MFTPEQPEEKALCQVCGVQTLDSHLDRDGRCEGCGPLPGKPLAAVSCEGFTARVDAGRGCARCAQPYADHTLGQPREWTVSIPGEWTQRDLAKFRRGLARLLDRHPGART